MSIPLSFFFCSHAAVHFLVTDLLHRVEAFQESKIVMVLEMQPFPLSDTRQNLFLILHYVIGIKFHF